MSRLSQEPGGAGASEARTSLSRAKGGAGAAGLYESARLACFEAKLRRDERTGRGREGDGETYRES